MKFVSWVGCPKNAAVVVLDVCFLVRGEELGMLDGIIAAARAPEGGAMGWWIMD